MNKEHVRQRINDRIAFYEAEIKKEIRKITQFNAYMSPIDTYRGAIEGLKEALDFLDEEPLNVCINCAYARMDGYEFAIHCQHKKSDFYDEDFDNPVSEDDTCEYFKASNVDIRFRDEKGGEE